MADVVYGAWYQKIGGKGAKFLMTEKIYKTLEKEKRLRGYEYIKTPFRTKLKHFFTLISHAFKYLFIYK